MSDDANQTKRHHVTREEEADRSLNHTTYSSGSALMVALIFLLVVFGVPIAQHVVEIKQNMAKRAAWDPKSGEPEPSLAPRIYQVVDLLPSSKQIGEAKGFWGYWGLIPSAESIGEFETSLKEQSILTVALLSPAQSVLTGTFDVGNEKAYCGQPGWLFYRSDVDYLTSDGFLTPQRLRQRAHAAEVQPDPEKAILDFKRQLDARGIKLVVVPMPTKPMIEPEMLVGPSAAGASLQNPSYGKFVSDMTAQGVTIYDPTKLLLDRKAARGKHQYLETDTHWTPEAMEAVASDLARSLPLRSPLAPAYKGTTVQINGMGDIAEMLKLPENQKIYGTQSVETHRVLTMDANLWTSRRDADVALLGDSFSNIFSLKGMGWGEASGFAEQLSAALNRPVMKIAINAGGSFASRKELARQMRSTDVLAGKKVVIYEFSMRDLAQGDWKMITLPTPPKVVTPPVITPSAPVKTPPTSVAVTPLKVTGPTPATIDPTKNESAKIEVQAPAGQWKATVTDEKGATVAELGQHGESIDATKPTELTWDGKDATGKPAAAGKYKISVEGSRIGGNPIQPVKVNVLVTGAPTGDIQAVGANPEKIDSVAKEKTSIEYLVPADGSYSADVLDAKGRVVRKLGKKKVKAGSYKVDWDGADTAGKPAADGKYAVRLSSSDKKSTIKPVPTPVSVASKAKPVTPVIPPKKGGDQNTGPKPPDATSKSDELVITGRIVDRAKDPVPGSVPYKDCLVAIQLTDVHVVSGKLGSGDIGVFIWGMRDNKIVDGAYTKGATVTFKLLPFAGSKYEGYNRQEMDSDASQALTYYWGERK